MTAFHLRLIAMICMFCDHLGRTIFPSLTWLTCAGRLAFPIYAFQLAEGALRTKSKNRYALRLLTFAIISEVPFDLMVYGTPLYFGHQNVLWTLLLGFFCVSLLEVFRKTTPERAIRYACSFIVVFLSFIAATLFSSDYAGFGVLQIVVFYWFRRTGNIPLVLILTFAIHTFGLSGTRIPIFNCEIPIQTLAPLAILPILLYNGKPGHRSKPWTWLCYLFYPVHQLLLFFTSTVLR